MKQHVAPFLRSTYNYDMNKASDESGLECKDKSLAQQHQAEETDINWMMKRYIQTGELNRHTLPPLQGDFTEAPDMQKALDLVTQARVAFMEQPANIRARFHNDPVEFVQFCSDEQNRDEMRQMGMWNEEAAKSFELQAQSQKDLDKANAQAAEELKALKKGKGDTK